MRMPPPLLILILAMAFPLAAAADSLTQIVQKDLVTLGYDPGNTSGEASTATIVAISKFQAEHDLEVTGEATPQLAGILKAEIKKQGKGGSPAAAPRSAPVAQAPAAAPAAPASGGMTAAQALCIQQKVQAKQEAEKKKRGFGRLLSAVSRTASRFGGGGLAGDIAQTTGDIYSANATAEDIKGAAEDLGLTESDLEECRNAQ
ncbi:MAG: peptidoglycan-binding domain-containing protein [Lysobacterales bacterium]